jgi:hypothetical protein
MDDFHLVLQKEGSGYHYYLDGQEVRPGELLELQIDSDWVLGRYEWCFHPETRPYLVIDKDKDDSVTLTEHSLLRWPKK